MTYIYISSIQAVMFASVLARQKAIFAIVKGEYLSKIVDEHNIPIAFTIHSRFSLKRPVSWWHCFKERRTILRQIKARSEVIFTFVSVDIEGLALIDRLSKFCRIYFFPMDWVERKRISELKYSIEYARFKLRTTAMQFLLNLPELRIYESSVYFNGIEKDFLVNRNISQFNEFTSPDDVRRQYAAQNHNFKAKILLLGLPEYTSSEEQKFMRIIERLSQYDGFLYISHPRYDNGVKMLSRQHKGIAETYVGPETLVIGVASAVMIYAVRNHSSVISILDIIYRSNEPEYEHFKQFLVREKVKNHIKFASSIDDLMVLVEESSVDE